MEKVLLIGFVLAICILAFPQGVMALDPPVVAEPVIVDATYGGLTTAFDCGTDEGWTSWNLAVDPGMNNWVDDALWFKVTSSHNWAVTAKDTNAALPAPQKEGYMISDEGYTFANPFQMQNYLGNPTNIIAGDVKVLGGSSGPANRMFSSDVWQAVTDADMGTDGIYSISITFTLTETF